MPRLEETIVVNRSAGDCFRYLVDFSTIEQWDPGVYRAEKRTAGAPEVGTVFDVTLSSAGRRIPMQYELVDITDGEQLVLLGSGDRVTARDVISVEAVDAETTRIHYIADLEFSGLMGAVVPALKPWLNRVGVKAVEGMRRALEPRDSPPEHTVVDSLKQKAVLPAAWDFTERGYLNMERKGLSEFVDGKTAVITGPTSGLGLATACELARLGSELILVGRNRDKLSNAVRDIRAFSGRSEGDIEVVEADLAELEQVRRAADEVAELTDSVEILVNNAGALFDDRQETVDGHERALAINLLSPFVLTEALIDKLDAGNGRVINVASGGMYMQPLRLDDMEYRASSYDGTKAYARAKRGLVALTDHWAAEFGDRSVTFNSMHPGWADTPGVSRSLPKFYSALEGRLRDARMGADTIVWLATSGAVDGVSGRFFFDRKPRPKAIFDGTEVTDDQRQQLVGWLRDHC